MVNALNQLTDIPKEIITFSDDMDGLRKVPDNVPQRELLEKNLHKPLTQVPDPFNKYNSFGEHNNEMLKTFLNSFFLTINLKVQHYFINQVSLILRFKQSRNYDGIMNIILPTLGKERQKTYSPFLPICPDTGHVLEIPIKKIDKNKSKAIFDNNGKELEISILDGCKS